MTRQETETLNELKEIVKAMGKQLEQNTKDTAATTKDVAEIKLTLAGWTSGRKVLVWAIGVLLSVGVILSSVYAAIRGSHS